MAQAAARHEEFETVRIDNLSNEDRKALEELTLQRELNQISAYTFDEGKRELLGLPPTKVPILVNFLMLSFIGGGVLLGSYILYPENTSTIMKATYSIFENWEQTSILALPGKFRDVKESSDAVADMLFRDCDLLICESRMYPSEEGGKAENLP